MNFFDKYKMYEKIKQEKPYNDFKFLSEEKSNKIKKFSFFSNCIMAILPSFLIGSILVNNFETTMHSQVDLVIVFSVIGGMFSFLIYLTIKKSLFNFLFKNKIKKLFDIDIDNIYKNHPLKSNIVSKKSLKDTFYGNYYVDVSGIRYYLNFSGINVETFLKKEISNIDNKFLVENTNQFTDFLSENIYFKNNEQIFNLFFEKYEKLLSEEFINLYTFKINLTLIMKSIFKDLKLFSEKRSYLNNYIESYKEVNHINNNLKNNECKVNF